MQRLLGCGWHAAGPNIDIYMAVVLELNTGMCRQQLITEVHYHRGEIIVGRLKQSVLSRTARASSSMPPEELELVLHPVGRGLVSTFAMITTLSGAKRKTVSNT